MKRRWGRRRTCFGLKRSDGSPIPPPPPSGIRAKSLLYEEMAAAKEWGLTPDEWYGKPREARAMMVAYERLRIAIDHMFAEEQRRKAGG